MQLAAIKTTNDIFESSGHLTREYYRSLLVKAGYPKATIDIDIFAYDRFKGKYPKISDWFNEDIIIRVSNNKERNISYRARKYITMMALHGLCLDYDYLFSLSGTDSVCRLAKRLGLDFGDKVLANEVVKLGYSNFSVRATINWAFYRIMLHKNKWNYKLITIDDLLEFKKAAVIYCQSPFIDMFFYKERKKNQRDRLDRFTSSEFLLHSCLYSLHVVEFEPRREHGRVRKNDHTMSYLKHDMIRDVTVRYLKQCKLIKEPRTIDNIFAGLNKFALWLENEYPEIDTYKKVTRKIIESYLSHLKEDGTDRYGRPYSVNALVNYIGSLKIFFDSALAWGYDEVPSKKIIFDYDSPKRPKALPRYIPEPDLTKLMHAIETLEDVYQRNALILARWTGARREEIRRLDIHALDHYQDGTPKLRIPIGKTNRDRWVPINIDAEQAYKELLDVRKKANNTRGLRDRKTHKETEYLFMRGNKMISLSYLYEQGLALACTKAGLLTTSGKPKYTAHQFRHTVGTTLANNGASLPTIMKVLGHESPEMSLAYATIFDSTVKDEYENAILKNQDIAGGDFAISIKNHELKQDEIDWIKANFHKTYLMTGHCFHHTREPMCDFADACYFCAKFVASRENISALTDKYNVEVKLIADAKEHGWDKEVARHEKVASRVREILSDLGTDVKKVGGEVE